MMPPRPPTGLRMTSAVFADRIGREGDRVRWMLAGLWSMLHSRDLAQDVFWGDRNWDVTMHSMPIGVFMRGRRSVAADLV